MQRISNNKGPIGAYRWAFLSAKRAISFEKNGPLLYNIYMANNRGGAVLAVDDDRINLTVLYRILSPEYTLLTAKSGEEAIKRARAGSPGLILLDVVMPDMSGFDVLRELRGLPETRDIPVVFITSLDSIEYETKGLQLGAAEYIKKPFSAQQVLNCVKAHIKDH